MPLDSNALQRMRNPHETASSNHLGKNSPLRKIQAQILPLPRFGALYFSGVV
jgi:hypothetical protein